MKVIKNTQGKVLMSGNNAYKVDATIDSNIVAGNIKKDVEILGVVGSYEGEGGGGLPSAYQRVTHIVGNGSQYIDTLYKPTNDTTCEVFLEMNGYRNESGFALFGAWASIEDGFALYVGNGSLVFWDNYNDDVSFDISHIPIDTPTLITKAKNKTYVNNVLVYEHPNAEFSCPNNFLLYNVCGINDREPLKANIFYAKIYTGDILARNFIPCYRKSDSKPGMYDLVSNTFFVNQGTGADFIVGPDVN